MAATPEAPASLPLPKCAPRGLAALVARFITDPDARGPFITAALCMGLFLVLFWEILGHFYYSWTTDDNYSHGFLVPLISLYFADLVARRGPVPIRGGAWTGGVLLVFALAVRLLAIPLPIHFLGEIAFLIGLAGLFALLFGSAALKRYWFALFFLIFMVPLPVALYAKLAAPLQLLASRVASAVMTATGLPVLCEGNKMTLPGGTQLFVAEACSGMRQLTGFLALTAAVAYLAARPLWYRLVILVSALPIALSANIARVVLTGYVMHFMNPRYAEGAYHTLEGLLMMGFGLLLLNTECWVLDQFGRGKESPGAGSPASRSLVVEPVSRALIRAGVAPEAIAARPGDRRDHVTSKAVDTLRGDPLDRSGGPGRVGALEQDRAPGATAPPGFLAAGNGRLVGSGPAGGLRANRASSDV